MSADGPIEDGGVLISADRIHSVGRAATFVPTAQRATRVECPRGVISPGLINAHDHLDYDHHGPQIPASERYEDRSQWLKGLDGHRVIVPGRAEDSAGPVWSELRQVMAGTTTIAGSGGRRGLLRNVEVPTLREGLLGPPVRSVVFPFGDHDDERRDRCPPVRIDPELNGLRLLLHVGEGTDSAARNELLCLAGRGGEGGGNLLGPDRAFVHAIPIDPLDAQLMAEHGTSLIWSPRSNLALYGSTVPADMADRMGVNIALSTDWTATGSMNLLRELRCARHLNEHSFAAHFSSRDLWRMVTENAARALGFEEMIGTLRAGSLADVAVYDGSRTHDPYSAVIDAGAADVLLVLRGGQPLYGQAGVVEQVPGGSTGCERLHDLVCGAPRTVCVGRETGMSATQVAAANADSYPLFFCGAPPDEPSCTPSALRATSSVPGRATSRAR